MLIGRVKKGVRSPPDSTSPRSRFLSSRSPSTMPSTSGAIGKRSSRRMKPTSPAPSITQMSNSRDVMAKAPTVHSTKTTGISRARGISRTHSSGRTSTRP